MNGSIGAGAKNPPKKAPVSGEAAAPALSTSRRPALGKQLRPGAYPVGDYEIREATSGNWLVFEIGGPLLATYGTQAEARANAEKRGRLAQLPRKEEERFLSYEELAGKHTPVDHPLVAKVSVADSRFVRGRNSVEIAFFDSTDNWIAEDPVPGFEGWVDSAPAGGTRVYPGVPLKYLQIWIADNGDQEKIASRVASVLHDQWREGRRLADGSFEPRWKPAGGDDSTEVDIANTQYYDLPGKWQRENLSSAISVVSDLTKTPYADDEELAARVHDAWLERNWEWAEPEQKLPYAELSEPEKQKDREVVLAARKTLGILV